MILLLQLSKFWDYKCASVFYFVLFYCINYDFSNDIEKESSEKEHPYLVPYFSGNDTWILRLILAKPVVEYLGSLRSTLGQPELHHDFKISLSYVEKLSKYMKLHPYIKIFLCKNYFLR